MAELFLRVLLWGGVGSVIFTIVLLLMRSLGVTDAARDPEGKFKRVSLRSFVGFASVVGLMIGFPAAGTLAILEPEALSFWTAWGVAYGVYFIINLYDFVVLDYLVVVRWHPGFLQLPDTDYYRTTRPEEHERLREFLSLLSREGGGDLNSLIVAARQIAAVLG